MTTFAAYFTDGWQETPYDPEDEEYIAYMVEQEAERSNIVIPEQDTLELAIWCFRNTIHARVKETEIGYRAKVNMQLFPESNEFEMDITFEYADYKTYRTVAVFKYCEDDESWSWNEPLVDF